MKDSKKTRKFNFIDGIIVAVVLIIVAFVAYIFMGSELLAKLNIFSGDDDFAYVRYNLSLSSVEDRYVGYIKDGADVRRGDLSIGRIEKTTVSEVERIELNERTEELVVVPYPDHKKVDIEIVAKAKLENGILLVDDDVKVAVGTYVEFVTSGFKSYGYITDFEVLDYEPELLKKKEQVAAVPKSVGEPVLNTDEAAQA